MDAALFVLLLSFETNDELARIAQNHAVATLTAEHATEGRSALQVRYEVTDWPNVFFAADRAFEQTDWTPWGALTFDATNPEAASLALFVRVDDAAAADGVLHCRTARLELPPDATTRCVVYVQIGNVGMRGLPPGARGELVAYADGNDLDLSHITAFQFFLAKPTEPHTLFFDNVRLERLPSLAGIVDQYGQYTGRDWPGKLHDVAEFAPRRQEEAPVLDAWQRPAFLDGYGGWAGGPQMRATGLFRTQQVDGRWWLVDPEGRLFWSVGIDTCTPSVQDTPVDGREAMFTWLPAAGEPFAELRGQWGGHDWFNFYRANLIRKYGADPEQAWVDTTLQRLQYWGVNTIANWSDPSLFAPQRVPFTVCLNGYGEAPWFDAGWRSMPDTFDERFAPGVEAAVAQQAAPWRDNPWVVGYFYDNELPWAGWGADGDLMLAEKALVLDQTWAAKREFVRMLQEKYGEVARLNAAWGTALGSWDALYDAPPQNAAQLGDAAREDLTAWLSVYADRYFRGIREALDRHDPNHLYLGCRFAAKSMPSVLAAAKYCDVVSFNIYQPEVRREEWDAVVAPMNKPAIIGEFHFGALDRGSLHPGLGPVANQEERAQAYVRYVTGVAQNPYFVGCHWFEYLDEPVTGRFDGENYNIGFIDVTDTPYPELTAAAREVDLRVYDLREGGPTAP